MKKKTAKPAKPDLRQEIAAMRLKLLDAFAHIGEMALNLKEAAEWLDGDQGPSINGNTMANALCSLEDVAASGVDVQEAIKAIVLKIEEHLLAEELSI